MRSQYPLIFGLGVAAWAAVLLVALEVGRAADLW